MTETEKNPWSDFENSDLSIAQIQSRPDMAIYYGELKQLAIPFDQLAMDIPKRTTKGRDNRLSHVVRDHSPVAPLAMVAHVASREMPTPARWGQRENFLCDSIGWLRDKRRTGLQIR